VTRTAPAGVRLLTREECYARIGEQGVGRVDLSRHALPSPVALPYVLDGQDILLSTLGTGIGEVLDAAAVTFEVDAHDTHDATGWRVVVVGTAVADARLVRIRPTDVTGYLLPTPWRR
jgi:nitroimidazol reductase NimA-like FMN-containing flavoprotein (pyridoxamine 5'-phosphate oxidase superfamily)